MQCLLKSLMLIAVLSVPLAGCKKSQSDAREELAKLNQQYSPDAFIGAARNEDTVAVKLFLEAGMDVNTYDSGHYTALEAAISKQNFPLVALLLENGADADLPNGKYAITPLMCAIVDGGNESIIRLLVSKTKNINATNEFGMTAYDSLVQIKSDAQRNSVAKLMESSGAEVLSPMTKQLYLKSFDKNIFEATQRACETGSYATLRDAVFNEIDALQKLGFSPVEVSAARKTVQKTVLDGMYGYNQTTGTSRMTEDAKKRNQWEKTTFEQLDKELKDSEPHFYPRFNSTK